MGESRCDAELTAPGGYKIHGYSDAHGRCCGSSLKFESLYGLVWLFCKSPWGEEKPWYVDKPAVYTLTWNNYVTAGESFHMSAETLTAQGTQWQV